MAAAATTPPCTFSAPAPLPELGASVEAAAVSELDVVVLRAVVLVDPVVELSSVVVVLEDSSVVVEDESSLVLVPLVLAPETVEEAPPVGRAAVPSAPLTVNAGAKLTLLGSVSSVMRNVYCWPASTASAGISKVAAPPEAGISAVTVSW